MSDQIKIGHFYRRHDGEIVGPATTDKCREYEIEVGGHYYNGKHNGFRRGHYALRWTLLEDLGTTDPRKPKKTRKAPAKKVRKVRVYFYRDGDGELCASQWKDTAERRHNASWGRSFSQIVNEPIPLPKKTKGKK